MRGARRGRILTFNCHEPYIHLLAKVGLGLDVVDGLPGRATRRWDTRQRPVPEGARLVRLEEARARGPYEAIIAHNVADLIDARSIDAPKVLMLHVSLTARTLEEPGAPPAANMRRELSSYLAAIGGVAVAVSAMKRDSWGLPARVIRPAVDPDEWGGHRGDRPALLRVANDVLRRPARFDWPRHLEIVGGLPWELVGHNPGVPGAAPAASWDDLRERYRSARAYVHSSGEGLDDGYNLAVLEAMATGMPVVTTAGHESPVEDGVSGFCSDSTATLRDGAARLLADPALARTLGDQARQRVADLFPVAAFREGWLETIAEAKARHAAAHADRAAGLVT
ncbi:MAG: glycosyltransferase family 4 protein [Deltaproteobacteria bacterium]|nr:glycosyltransferase family 4 protein [Deltaproteobacteria bacterium]